MRGKQRIHFLPIDAFERANKVELPTEKLPENVSWWMDWQQQQQTDTSTWKTNSFIEETCCISWLSDKIITKLKNVSQIDRIWNTS